MPKTTSRAPGGAAAQAFLRERFGIEWGDDVLGITEDGVSAEDVGKGGGLMKFTLVARCTRDDVETFVRLLWTKPSAGEADSDA